MLSLSCTGIDPKYLAAVAFNVRTSFQQLLHT